MYNYLEVDDMPKIKKEPYDSSKKKNLFFYEILGIVLAVLSFFALAKLGSFGLYLFLTVKLLFGDWAFLFIIIGILAGCYFLMVHDHLPISSLRVIGIFFIFLSLIVLSHFSMHKYVKQYTEDYFSLTISLYIDYFKTANSDSITGGGIIGMLFFYAFYYLLSIPGVVIISLLLILLGVSFVSRKTLNEFIKVIIKVLKFLFGKFKLLIKKSNGFIKNINKEFNSLYIKKLPRNFIKKQELFDDKNYSNVEELVSDVKLILNRLNIYHYDVDYYLTPHLVVIQIKSFLKINHYELENELSRIILKPYLLKINEDDSVIMIELSKDLVRKISLYEVFNLYNNNIIFLGINDHFEVEALNGESSSVLLFIEKINHLYFYIVLAVLRKYKVMVLDLNKELELFKDYLLYETNADYINKIIVDVENKESDEIEVYFINLTKKVIDKELCDKIRYLIELSKELNFYFIVRIDNYIEDKNYFYNSFSYLMTIDVKSIDVLKLFGFYNSNGLKLGEEGLIKTLDVVARVAIGGLCEEEVKKIGQ